MTIASTEPVAQTYFSTLLSGVAGKGGAVVYGKHGGFCCEMQRFADGVVSPRSARWRTLDATKRDYAARLGARWTLLKAGQTYVQKTVYGFEAM